MADNKKQPRTKKDRLWIEAKSKCRLNSEDIRMAKETRYHQEMLQQQEKIRELAKRASCKTITLLCFEREDNPHCHRHLLKKLIEKYK